MALRYVAGRRKRHEIQAKRATMERRVLRSVADIAGSRPPRQWGPWILERWVEGRAEKVSVATLAVEWRMARRFLRWAAVETKVPDPCRGLKAPKPPRAVPRALDRDQLAAIVTACPDNRARAIIWLLAGMGLRRSEVSGLRMEEWSLADRTMIVVGKSGHERVLPVPTVTEQALIAYLREHPTSSGPIVRRFTDGGRLGPSGVGHIARTAMEAAGVKRAAWDRIGAHSLRHTMASDTLDAGANVRVVQGLLGHQSLATTDRYLRHASIEQMRTALEDRNYPGAA